MNGAFFLRSGHLYDASILTPLILDLRGELLLLPCFLPFAVFWLMDRKRAKEQYAKENPLFRIREEPLSFCICPLCKRTQGRISFCDVLLRKQNCRGLCADSRVCETELCYIFFFSRSVLPFINYFAGHFLSLYNIFLQKSIDFDKIQGADGKSVSPQVICQLFTLRRYQSIRPVARKVSVALSSII